ncbi:hypothetical protein B6U98_05955 [Thermoplasmatales archaeon ex4572_165]|nr:MAG: hypothetical protein B6U98_05955 [Thermoplasmatales archaeon ex4572_165]
MKIRIVDEIKKTTQESKPPTEISFKYVPGETTEEEMKEFIQSKFEKTAFKGLYPISTNKEKLVERMLITDLNFYISEEAFRKMYLHCVKVSQKGLEAMGFLIGRIQKSNDSIFSIVDDVVTSDLESTPISVRFRRDAFDKLFHQLDEISYDYIILGWYHSHPGFSCFMSEIDMLTQKRMFNEKYHAAIVIDPIAFSVKTFRTDDNICFEIPFAIISKK